MVPARRVEWDQVSARRRRRDHSALASRTAGGETMLDPCRRTPVARARMRRSKPRSHATRDLKPGLGRAMCSPALTMFIGAAGVLKPGMCCSRDFGYKPLEYLRF